MEFVKIFTGYLHRKMLCFVPVKYRRKLRRKLEEFQAVLQRNRIHIFRFGNLCKKGTSQNAKSML